MCAQLTGTVVNALTLRFSNFLHDITTSENIDLSSGGASEAATSTCARPRHFEHGCFKYSPPDLQFSL